MPDKLINNHSSSAENLLPGLKVGEIAVRYHQWITNFIRPYLGNRIIEIGPGIGNMSRFFLFAEHLILLEKDPKLLTLLEIEKLKWAISSQTKVTLLHFDVEKQLLAPPILGDTQIDTIVSFNVLEHIQDDHKVIINCANLLRQSSAPKKRIITFVPAHSWAYGKTDQFIGHYRRYNKKMLTQLHKDCTPDAKLILYPFNFVGIWGWLINGRFLKNPHVGSNLVGCFEKFCPLFQKIDKLIIFKLHIPIGNSLIAIHEWSSEK